jgi:hypothetical protein
MTPEIDFTQHSVDELRELEKLGMGEVSVRIIIIIIIIIIIFIIIMQFIHVSFLFSFL